MMPTFLMSLMEITPAMIEKKTSGQTIHLIRFRKIVPKGLMYVFAKSGLPVSAIPAPIASTRAIKI